MIGAAIGVALQALLDRSASPRAAAPIIVQRPASRRRHRSRQRAPILDENEELVVLALIVLGAVAGYLKARSEIAAGIALASCFVYGLALGAFSYLFWRGARSALNFALALVGCLVVAIGFADVRELRAPHYFTGRYRALLAEFDRHGLTGVIDKFHIDGVLFVLYQALGVLLFAGAVGLALAGIASVLAEENIAAGARGMSLWQRLALGRGRSAAALALALVFAAVSWVCCSGLGYRLVHSLVPQPAKSSGTRPVARSIRAFGRSPAARED